MVIKLKWDQKNVFNRITKTLFAFQKVEPVVSAPPAGGDARGTLLDEIRRGKELRKVTPSTSSAAKQDMATENTLAGALARALADRAKAIHSDSDEEEDEEDDDDEWDEWPTPIFQPNLRKWNSWWRW